MPQVYKSLKSYIQSLNRVRRIGLSAALPGHGTIIEKPEARILEALRSIEERRSQILQVIEQDVHTPFQIAEELFPAFKEEHTLLAMSETIGHLELLEEEGIVKRDDGPTLHFSANYLQKTHIQTRI